jgi:predicted amidohydrolase YtcJ
MNRGESTDRSCIARLAGLLAAGAARAGVAPRRAVAEKIPAAEADLVLINGRVLTVDANDSIAEAIAIGGGKIVAVGSNADISKLVSAKTRVIDLHGRTATPGLVDSHGHFADGGVSELYDVKLSDASSIEEIIRRVGERVVKLKPGEWVLGSGWDEGKLAELLYLYASDQDKVAPNNAVWLMHTTGHCGAANSYALRLAHITAATENPPAGTIDRDPQGKPTGVLKEAAKDGVATLVPPTSPEQERNAILHMIDALHREGCFLDDKVGSIEAGKDADIAVWDRDRDTIPTSDLKNLTCEMTLFSGQIVYQAAASPISVKISDQDAAGSRRKTDEWRPFWTLAHAQKIVIVV